VRCATAVTLARSAAAAERLAARASHVLECGDDDAAAGGAVHHQLGAAQAWHLHKRGYCRVAELLDGRVEAGWAAVNPGQPHAGPRRGAAPADKRRNLVVLDRHRALDQLGDLLAGNLDGRLAGGHRVG